MSTSEPEAKKPKLDCDAQQGKEQIDACDKDKKADEHIPSQSSESNGSSLGEGKLMKETDVGIHVYISKHDGFSGVVKQRYSDFLVNEINQKGEIVTLTTLSAPEESPAKAANFEALEDDWKLQITALQNDPSHAPIEFEVDCDKERRTKIHRAINENYNGVSTKTIERNSSKFIQVFLAKGKQDRRARWEHDADYCRFVLYKENKDTQDALSVIANMLRERPGKFTFAGTKDKRAKTSQLITVHRIDGARLHKINSRLINMAVGNFSYIKTPLRLGDLNGNHFSIVLRNATCTKEQVKAAMSSLENAGFINYFGMQRFGTTSVPTHLVGRVMLQGKFDEAIDLILKPRKGDSTELAAARATWIETRDPSMALTDLGSRTCLERHLLIGLCKRDKNDFVGALSHMPRNTRLMYIHAYQSYIWNSMVTSRIRRHGLVPVVGDLVLKSSTETDSAKSTPLHLTAAILDQYSIDDVVLPLPGYDVIYPANELADEYAAMLKADGLENGLRSSVRDYSLPGSYRRLIGRPTDVSWRLTRYSDHTLPLVLSDLEKLKETELAPEVEDGRMQAVVVQFSLQSSCYATMALREILKCDTSAESMATLNVT